MLNVLPQQFYQNPNVGKILVDGISCVIHKKFFAPVYQKEGYVSAHAILLVLKGMVKVDNDKGFVTNVQEKQMVLLPKGLYMVSDIIPENEVFEAVMFFFDDAVIADFVNAMQLESKRELCVSHFSVDYAPAIQMFTETLLQVYSKKENAHRTLTRLKLFELLHLISAASTTECFHTALVTLNNKERRSLKGFMQANFSKPLSIEDYAYLTGRSLSSFRRDFIEQFGVSPKQWLIEQRMEKACHLLTNNHTNVSDVAAEVGYDNISHFVKAFHKRYGMPPKQFLLKQRKEVLV